MTSSPLRARCDSAELRAFTAERALKRTRAQLRNTRVALGEALEDLDAARHGGAQLQRVLRRLAAHQLGEGASRRDVDALVHRWLDEDRKRGPRQVSVAIAINVAELNAMVQRMMRGEDSDG